MSRPRPIRRLLVCNRGEIARRIIAAADGLGIETVAVYAEGDAGAPFVAEAGRAVALPGRRAAETYLDAAALLGAARRTGCDAVHPGYGFLSESAEFAGAVRAAGLVFVGPPTSAIAALGDKLAAKAEMRAAGVPVLEVLPLSDGDGVSPGSYPVMVKATAGGGGKGMRVVEHPSGLAEALAAARREAGGAFGDDRVFVEPYLADARHVEVQIFGDSHGSLVHLFERECSIQRRHQKVIEEAPSPAVTPELRERLGEAALRVGRAVGYENAGTVEFLLDGAGRFYFLEVNTRLQVEHPVTEAVTGVDLVREQLLVAEGAPLSFRPGDLSISGHAIEARLYAEDPAEDFLPQAGEVVHFLRGEVPGVRYDAGVESGSVVGVEFDPMLAKVIAHGATRREAAGRLARALERTRVHGLSTNREHLVAILRHEAFLAGETTTHFLTDHEIPARARIGEEDLRLGLVAAALAAEQAGRASAGVLASIPSGWRTSAMPPQLRRYRHEGRGWSVAYRRRRDGSYEAHVAPEGGEESGHRVVRHGGTPEAPDLAVDGLRCRLALVRAGRRLFVDFDGGASLELEEVADEPEPAGDRREGGLAAPMPGRVVSVHAAAGERVEAGSLLVVVEAMKMEHRVRAAAAGVVSELRVKPGDQVSGGDLLVVLEPADPAGED